MHSFEIYHSGQAKQTNKQAYTQCSHAGVGLTQAHPNKPVYIDVIFTLGIRTNSKYQLRICISFPKVFPKIGSYIKLNTKQKAMFLFLVM